MEVFYQVRPSLFNQFTKSVYPEDADIPISVKGAFFRYFCRNKSGQLMAHTGYCVEGLYYEVVTRMVDGIEIPAFQALGENVALAMSNFQQEGIRQIAEMQPSREQFFGIPVRYWSEWNSLLHPDDREFVTETVSTMLLEPPERYPKSMEYRIVSPDGDTRWIHERFSRPVDQAPLLKIPSVLTDVTLCKRQDSLLVTILDSIIDAVLVVSTEGRIIHWNKLFQNLWKIPDRLLIEGDDHRVIDWMARYIDLPYVGAFLQQVYGEYKQPTVFRGLLKLVDGRFLERTSNPHTVDGVVVGHVICYRLIHVSDLPLDALD
ncbi:PAS domain-containing protein [Leptolyngbya sp. AN02str]|uniref:PAS domain-containing protein n=1 Tax=Leptolyngbya sp. AN02str TaxID=3423363 RepID=UPI003D31FFD1